MIRSRDEVYDCIHDGQQLSTLDELWTFLPPITELEELQVFKDYIPSQISHLAGMHELELERARRSMKMRKFEAAVIE